MQIETKLDRSTTRSKVILVQHSDWGNGRDNSAKHGQDDEVPRRTPRNKAFEVRKRRDQELPLSKAEVVVHNPKKEDGCINKKS